MPKQFLSALLIIGSLQSFGQHKDSGGYFLPVQFSAISFENPLPFKKITIVDSRFDTTKIGYLNKKKKDYRLTTQGGLASTVESLFASSLKAAYAPSSNQSLLLVIKKFWLRDPTETEVVKAYNDPAKEHEPFSICTVKFEVYLMQANLYFPVLRLDSTYYIDAVRENKSVSSTAFDDCLVQILKKNIEHLVQSKKGLTREAIDSFNANAFKKPIFLESQMHKGVFLSFTDFLQNRNNYPDFTIESGDEIDNLYVINNGNKELLPKFWGFCDGQNYFVKSGHNFYSLYKQGQAFEFVANVAIGVSGYYQNNLRINNPNSPRDMANGMASYGLGKILEGKGRFIQMSFQINMETGEAY